MNLNFDIPFTKYKHGEVQFSYEGKQHTDYSLRFSITTKQDHAGIYFMIEIWRLIFSINFYDDRHWDYENDCWTKYGDSHE